jgi:drug/metabolite transporter (DMT)-like permease
MEWMLLGVLSILWGTSFSLTEVILTEVPPFTLVFLRVLFAALSLLVLLRLFRMRFPRGLKAWSLLMVTAFIGNAVPFSFIVWGQQYIQSSLAAILMATGPLFTLLLAHFATHDERMRPGKVLALVLGFIAVVVLVGPDALKGIGSNVIGQLCMLAAALSYGIASIIGRRYQELGLKPLPLAAAQLSIAVIFLLPFTISMDQPWTQDFPSWPVALAVVVNGVLSTGIPYIIYFRILAVGGATNVMLVTFLVPLVAAVTGSLALNEQLDPRHFASMGLLACALIAIDGRLPKKLGLPTLGG